MTWRKGGCGLFRYDSGYDRVASTFPRLDSQRFPLPRGPRPRKPGSPSTIAGSAHATTSLSIDGPAQTVLGCVENGLVRVAEASGLGYSPNRRELASRVGSEPTRTALRSPWQNGVAERWVGSCRRDLLNHVIVLNERHLKRLMSSYLLYYHEDRMRWQRSLKSYSSEDKLFFLKPGGGAVQVFCEHLSLSDETACNLNRRACAKQEEIPLA
jgi:hypothetical protein